MSDAKIDKILEKVHSIERILDRNTDSLELHMKRTDLLEKKLKPVEDHVFMVNTGVKLLGAAAAVMGVIATFLKIYQS